jgi:hypothetical protein
VQAGWGQRLVLAVGLSSRTTHDHRKRRSGRGYHYYDRPVGCVAPLTHRLRFGALKKHNALYGGYQG